MGSLRSQGLNERAIEVGVERINDLIDTTDPQDLEERNLVQSHVAQLMFMEARKENKVELYQQLRAKIKQWPATVALQKEILNIESRLVWEGGAQQRYHLPFIENFLNTYPETYYSSKAFSYFQRIKFYRDTLATATLSAYQAYLTDPRSDLEYMSAVRSLLCEAYLKQERSSDHEPFNTPDLRADYRLHCTGPKWESRRQRLVFDYDLKRVNPKDQNAIDRLVSKYRDFKEKSIQGDLAKLKNNYYVQLFEEAVASQDPHKLLRFARQSDTPQYLSNQATEIAFSLDTERTKTTSSVMILSSYLSFWKERLSVDTMNLLIQRLDDLLKSQSTFDAYEVRALLRLVNSDPQLSSRGEIYKTVIKSHLSESLKALSVSEFSTYYESLQEEPRSELTALYFQIAQKVFFERDERYQQLRGWVADQNMLHRLLSELAPISKLVNISNTEERERVIVQAMKKADQVFKKLKGQRITLQSTILQNRYEETKLTAYGKKLKAQNERRIKRVLAKKGLRLSDLDEGSAFFALWAAPELMLLVKSTDCEKCQRETGRSSLNFILKPHRSAYQEGITDRYIEAPCEELGLSCGREEGENELDLYGLGQLTFTELTVIVDGLDLRKREEIFEGDQLKLSGVIQSIYLSDHGLVIKLSNQSLEMSLIK